MATKNPQTKRRKKRRSKAVIKFQRVDDYVWVAFPYDEEILAEVQKVEGRIWDGQVKQWKVPVECFKELHHYTKGFQREYAPNLLAPHLFISDRYPYQLRLHSLSKKTRAQIKGEYKTDQFGIIKPGQAIRALKSSSFVVDDQRAIMDFIELLHKVRTSVPKAPGIIRTGKALFPYQYKPVNTMLAFKRIIVGDEMGLGKAAYGVFAFARLLFLKRISRCLVVCLSSKKYDWRDEFDFFTKGISTAVVDGDKVKRTDIWNGTQNVTICNYEQLVSDFGESTTQFWDVVMADEITKIKSFKSKRTKAFRKLESEYLWMFSGTVVENNLYELYNALRILHPTKLEPVRQFGMRYVKQDQWGGIKGYRNMDEIRARVQGIVVRRFREDKEVITGGLDKQPTVHDEDPIIVDLCPVTQRLYNAVSEDMRTTAKAANKFAREFGAMNRLIAELIEQRDEIKRIKVKKKVTRKINRLTETIEPIRKDMMELRGATVSLFTLLRQIGDSPFLLHDSNAEVAEKYQIEYLSKSEEAHSTKLHKLVWLLQEEIPEGAKVIVFSCFERMVRRIAQELKSHGITRMTVDGSLGADAKYQRVQSFKKRRTRILVATDCLAYGQNLQEAQYIVNYDLPFNPAVLQQRNMRNNRGVATMFDDLYIYNLIANTPVELRVLEVLKPKVEVSKQVFMSKKRQGFGFKGIVKLLEI